MREWNDSHFPSFSLSRPRNNAEWKLDPLEFVSAKLKQVRRRPAPAKLKTSL